MEACAGSRVEREGRAGLEVSDLDNQLYLEGIYAKKVSVSSDMFNQESKM